MLLLIEQALKDEDVQVRRLGSAAMNRVAWASAAYPEYKNQHGITVDLENDPELRDAILPVLMRAANDSDAEVREGVILALFRAYPLTKGIERDLLKRFKTEPSPKIRAVIVQCLAKHGSLAAEPLALRALDDADANVRGWAADALARIKALPEEALPKLVRLLESESSPFTRQKFADAIGSYGGQASEYLPQLRKSAVSETDETTKLKLKGAIESIQFQQTENP